MRHDLPDHARRLDAILRDLRYGPADGSGRVDWKKACRVVNRRVLRPLEEARFGQIVKGAGRPLTADEAVQVADGLGFDVRRLLYDDPPRRPERPANLMDELDLLWAPD